MDYEDDDCPECGEALDADGACTNEECVNYEGDGEEYN